MLPPIPHIYNPSRKHPHYNVMTGMFSFQNLNCKSAAYIRVLLRVLKMCHMSKLRSSINDVINQNRGSKPLICAYCLSNRFIPGKKNLRPIKGYLMASQRPIRRKPCSHANNFESLIAFRNTYIWGGGRDGGRRGGEGFSGCNMLVIFFLLFSFWFIPSLSLSLHLLPQLRKTRLHYTYA